MNTYTDMFTETLKTLDLDNLLPNPVTARDHVRSTDCGPMPGFIVSQSSHRDSTADHCE